MTKLLERPEVRDAPHNLEVEEVRPQAPPPMRQLPPPRRDVRWIRWMVAIGTVVLVALAAIVMMDTTEEPVAVSDPVTEAVVAEAPITIRHPLTIPEVGTSHPLAETYLPEAAVFAPVAPIEGVYVPGTMTGSFDPLGDRFVREPAPIDSSVYLADLGSGYQLGDYYVPSTLTGSTDPVLALGTPAVPDIVTDVYVPSTVTGSANPFVELGPAFTPDLAYVQPNLPGLRGVFGALEAEVVASVLPPNAYVQPVLPGLSGVFGAIEAEPAQLDLVLPFGILEAELITSVMPPQAFVQPDLPGLTGRFGMLESEANFTTPDLSRVIAFDPSEMAFIEGVNPGAARFVAPVADVSFAAAETARFMRLEPALVTDVSGLSLTEIVDLLPATLPDMPLAVQTPISLTMPFVAGEAELIESVLPASGLNRFLMLESEANYVAPDLSRVIAFDPSEMAFIEGVSPGAARFVAPVAADASFEAAEFARFARLEPVVLSADGSSVAAETARFMRLAPVSPPLNMADLTLAEMVDLLPATLPDMPPVAAALDAQISLTMPFVAGEAALIESVLPTAGLNRFLMLESEANYVAPDLSRVIAFDPGEIEFLRSVNPAAGRFSMAQPTATIEMDLRGLTRPFGLLVVERPFG